MANKFLDQNGLLYFWQKIVNKFVAKESGKGLSEANFTVDEKNKLLNIEKGANKTTVEDVLTSTSRTNALSANQGKVLDDKIKNINDSLSDLGGGDMLKSVYDTNDNGKVDKADDADKLGGHTSDYYAKADDILNKFIQYTSQTLTTEQKAQARANIGAGTSNFSGDYNDLTNKPDDFAPATHTHEMSDVNGLNDALNGKSDSNHKHTTNDITDFQTEMAKKIDASIVGQANGVATLDGSGLIPSTQLPSYVDDVVEGYAKTTTNTTTSDDGFETTTVTVDGFYKENTYTNAIVGESGKIYVDLVTNISYRWGGTTFVQITSSDMTAITNTEIDVIVATS